MLLYDLVYLLVTVLIELCIVHCTVREAYSLLGRHCRSSCKECIPVYDTLHRRSVYKKKIYIPSVRLIERIPFPVSAYLRAHIEYSVIAVIIEKSESFLLILVYADIERNMLIHRISGFRIMSDSIFWRHPHMTAFFIKMPCLLSEAIEMILFPVDSGIMGETAQLILVERSFRKI